MEPNEIVLSNLKFYESIRPKNPPDSYTVLATVNNSRTGQLLAMATGTQASLRQYPDDIQDCHAESLVKRAYKRYLVDAISRLEVENSVSVVNGSSRAAELCRQRLTLFVTQFPCGLANRYEGLEPIDARTGKTVRRKPGRGCMKDGNTIYVDKDSCLVKLQKWVANGLQGSKLVELFDAQSRIDRILIGDCEADPCYDYKLLLNRLRASFSSDLCPSIELVRGVRRPEFIFNAQFQAQPVALVWWRSSDRPILQTRELIVDGRRMGLTKSQCSSGDRYFQLRIADYQLRDDLATLESNFNLVQPLSK